MRSYSNMFLIVSFMVFEVFTLICLGKMINERTQQNIIIARVAGKAGVPCKLESKSNIVLRILAVDPIVHVKDPTINN